MRVRSGELDDQDNSQPVSCPMCNVAIFKEDRPSKPQDEISPQPRQTAAAETGAELLGMNAYDPPIDRPPPASRLLQPYQSQIVGGSSPNRNSRIGRTDSSSASMLIRPVHVDAQYNSLSAGIVA